MSFGYRSWPTEPDMLRLLEYKEARAKRHARWAEVWPSAAEIQEQMQIDQTRYKSAPKTYRELTAAGEAFLMTWYKKTH